MVYETCPVYETDSFLLRKVLLEDAKALLACYSDPAAVAKMNADCCTSDFYYTSLAQMEDCIRFWLQSYQDHAFVRFSIVPKGYDSPVGTVEIFGGEWGVLRIDIAAAYDKEPYIEEFIRLARTHFMQDFEISSLKIKTANTPERISLLEKYGFVPSKTFRPQCGYHEYPA